MSTTILPTIPNHSHAIDASIQQLRAQLEQSKAEQKRYQIQLNALQSIRSQISISLEELSTDYKKQIKSLEQKVQRLENENKQLKKHNSLYEMQVRNFEKRILEKDSIISTILAKEFFLPVIGYIHQRSDAALETNQIEKTQAKNIEKLDQLQSPVDVTHDLTQLIVLSQQKSLRMQENKLINQKKLEIAQETGRPINPVQNYQPIQKIQKFSNPTLVEQLQHLKTNFKINIKEKDQLSQQSHKENISQRSPLKEGSQLSKQKHIAKEQTVLKQKQEIDHWQNFQNFNDKTLLAAPNFTIDQPKPTFNNNQNQATQFVQIYPVIHKAPRPKKKGPIQPHKLPKKQAVNKSKSTPKYEEYYPEQPKVIKLQLQIEEKTNFPLQISKKIQQQNKIFEGFQITNDFSQTLNQEQKYKHQQQQAVFEQFGQKITVDSVNQNQTSTHQESQKLNLIQSPNDLHSEQNDVSQGSIVRSKKSKRQKPRPVNNQVVSFADDVLPGIKPATNPTISFFDKFLTNQNPSYPIPVQNQQLKSHQTQQDDHQMHSLVDESSIQQIDDHSMISNPIFPQDNDFERVANEEDKRRKGSTEDQRGFTSEGMVQLPPSKKMSKKKAKRETVEVMDPGSFV